MAPRRNFRRVTATTAIVLIGLRGFVSTNVSAAAGTAETTASAQPTQTALDALEQSAYGAWKAKNAKFWEDFLSDQFVGWGAAGRLDKASATREYTGADCQIQSYALSGEQTSPLGKQAMLITHKISVDGACGGQKLPAASWAAGIYVRHGDHWQGAFHAEAPIIDAKAAAVKPISQKDLHIARSHGGRGARTDAMLTAERDVWEAWRQHDAKKMAALTAADISFINIFGTYLANKTDALKDWAGVGCDVAKVTIADAEGTMLSPAAGILTFKATADGTCYGQKVGAVWGTTIYLKEGDTWKWRFGINLPAPAPTP
jgi:hypothetical protein